MQIVAGLYMIAIAAHLLRLHPLFRYVIIQPPHFLSRKIRQQAKSKDIFAPALLGILTIVIPCGTTLAIEAAAVSSGSPLMGGAIMAAFILGTAPIFFAVGFLTSTLGETFRFAFVKLAAVILVIIGLVSINGSLVLLNSPVTFQSLMDKFPLELNLDGSQAQIPRTIDQGNIQVANIDVYASGYSPSKIQAKAGKPLAMNLTTHGGLGCTSQFLIPALKIKQDLPQSGTKTLTFVPPTKGSYTWSCSMGMYTGTLEVT